MNEEELKKLQDKITELEQKASKYDELETKYNALNEKVNPPTPDPDEKYKPSTWKDLHEKVDHKAEEAALRVLEEAERKKEQLKKEQEDLLAENQRKIDESFKKLEEGGVIEKTENKDDLGARQRQQILGSLIKSGGMNIEEEAQKLKSLWDKGLEYDFESNSVRAAGGGYSPNRNAVVGSSAARSQTSSATEQINLRGVRGLDDAQILWERLHGKI